MCQILNALLYQIYTLHDNGFPKSITLVGQKYWYKPTVDMYVQNWINNALRAAKLVQVPFTEFQKSVSLRPIEPTGGQGLRRLSP